MNDNFEAYDRYQVLGQNLQNLSEGLGNFSLLASAVLLKENLGVADANGYAKYELTKWYPLTSFLRAFNRIGREYGGYLLRQAGANVPKFSKFPPSVVDITSALGSLDIAYHLNHGINNTPLFSLETGQKLGGIGHYTTRPVQGKKQIICVCENPYPCDFDQGLIQAVARRFEPSATLVHDTPSVCRSKGARSCTYSVTW